MSAAAGQALSPTSGDRPAEKREVEEEDARWRPVMGLPCRFTADLSLPNFKVADLLALRAGSVIRTDWEVARDVPLRVNGTLVAWGELEGAGTRLAVRLTELA